MRTGPRKDFHLTYCTNIHPGETWPEVAANLERFALPLKARLSPSEPFGIGLRLSNQAAGHLLTGSALEELRSWLDANGLYVFTLNGFPYGGFHRQVVKDHVYEPDWRTEERLAYSSRLIDILAYLLPEGLDGSISTSPLSYKPWLTETDVEEAFQRGARNLIRLAARLHEVYRETGNRIHFGLEPEPDCLIENAVETIDFFERYLLPAAAAARNDESGAKGSSIPDDADLLRYIGVCYDACHFAVEFDDPLDAISRLDAAGIRLSKIQISSALRVDLGHDRREIRLQLEPFAESTYLHQVVGRRSSGELQRHRDLPSALNQIEEDAADEWRIHYHVPIFIERYGMLNSTQPDLVNTLRTVVSRRPSTHLEIETYTWDVLPEHLKTDVVTSIAREYEWVLAQLER